MCDYQASKKKDCESQNIKKLRQYLADKCLGKDLINEIVTNGLTDDIMRKLESLGMSFDDMMAVENAFKADSTSDVCDCTFKSTRSASTRTNHADFLIDHYEGILSKGLKEVVMKKPYDPIEYLGYWLLHYRECEEKEKQRKEFMIELLEERLKYAVPPPPVREPCGEEEGSICSSEPTTDECCVCLPLV